MADGDCWSIGGGRGGGVPPDRIYRHAAAAAFGDASFAACDLIHGRLKQLRAIYRALTCVVWQLKGRKEKEWCPALNLSGCCLSK